MSAGSIKVTPDPRIRLVNGYSLEIRNASTQDAGDYTCQIATLTPREITHTVEILGELFIYETFKVRIRSASIIYNWGLFSMNF